MAHIHELIDLTVSVFVVHKNRVLLRLHEKYNVWTGAGGHVELDEDANQAAIRETKEEVGLDVLLIHPDFVALDPKNTNCKELIPPMAMNIHKIYKGPHHHMDLVYVGVSDSDSVVLEQDTDKVRWFTKDELLKFSEVNERQRHYALKALEIAGKID